MAIQLGSAYGKVSLDTKGFVDGIKLSQASLANLAQVGERLGNSLKDIGGKLTLGLTLPIVGLGAAAIKAASSFEETKNKTSVIFGDMSKDIMQWSENSAQAFGQSQTQALNAASTFAIFGKAAGLAGEDLSQFAKSNVELASDFASFFETSPEEAIIAIGAAYRGESEPIRRYGVLINDAAVRQKALELGLISTLGPITQQQRILAVNALILEQTKDAQGDFARTSGSLANATRTLNGEFQKSLVMLGQNLLPIALQVVQGFNKLLTAFNNLSPVQQKMVLGFLALLAAAGPVLSILGTLMTTLSGLVVFVDTLSTLGFSFAGIGTAITGVTLPAIGALSAALLPVLAVLGAVLLTVGLLLIAWKTNFLGMREALQTSVKFWKAIWSAFTAFLRGDTSAAFEFLQAALDVLHEHFQKVFAKFDGLRAAWGNFLNFLRTAIGSAVSYISKAFSGVNWSQIGKYITLGIANGLLFGLPNLLAIVIKVATAVLTQIKKTLGIKSPSKEAMKLGMFTGQGFSQGVMLGMDPQVIAQSLAKPVTANQSTTQTITNHFASGLTTREVRSMIDERLDGFANQLIVNLGGA